MATRQWWSTFGSGVSLAAAEVGGSGQWVQEFTGTDSETGNNFAPAGLPGGSTSNKLYYVVDQASVLSNFVVSSVAPHAFTQRVLATDPAVSPSLSRNQFAWYNTAADFQRTAGILQRVTLQSNLHQLMPFDGNTYFRMFAELREVSDTARITFSLQRYTAYPYLIWRVRFQAAPFTGDSNVIWEYLLSEETVPLPLGVPTDIAINWVHSAGGDGRVKLRVGNQVVMNHVGPTRLTNRLDHMDVLKVYMGAESLAFGEANQVVSKLELWDGEPGTGNPAAVPSGVRVSGVADPPPRRRSSRVQMPQLAVPVVRRRAVKK